MMSQISFVFAVVAATLLTSSAYKLSPPSNYSWPQNTTNLCFAAELDLRLNVQYLQADGSNNTVTIPVDNSTYETYRVSCSEPSNVHELTISLLQSFTNIILQFTVNASNATSLTKVYGFVSINDKQTRFPKYANATVGIHYFSSNESLFENERASSYRCETKTTVTGFGKSDNVIVTSIELENLRIRPFADGPAPFDNHAVEKVCKADDEKDSNLVPIIVGACLAVLVVIVLVAYLIGRRRSRTGYQSV